jgi:hypothetical protein
MDFFFAYGVEFGQKTDLVRFFVLEVVVELERSV